MEKEHTKGTSYKVKCNHCKTNNNYDDLLKGLYCPIYNTNLSKELF